MAALRGPKKKRIAAHGNESIVPEGQRPCPICGKIMMGESNRGVRVDVCEEHGIWLDSGELPKIIAAIRGKQMRTTRKQIHSARRQGKIDGALWGWWSLLS